MENDNLKWVRIFSSAEQAELELSLNVPRALKYKEHRLCLVRRSEGITAFVDECPHKRVPLSQGLCPKEGEIVCYLHSYIYRLDTGREVGERAGELIFYPVRQTDDGVFIGFPK